MDPCKDPLDLEIGNAVIWRGEGMRNENGIRSGSGTLDAVGTFGSRGAFHPTPSVTWWRCYPLISESTGFATPVHVEVRRHVDL